MLDLMRQVIAQISLGQAADMLIDTHLQVSISQLFVDPRKSEDEMNDVISIFVLALSALCESLPCFFIKTLVFVLSKII